METKVALAELERLRPDKEPTVRERQLQLWRQRFDWDAPSATRLTADEARAQLAEIRSGWDEPRSENQRAAWYAYR